MERITSPKGETVILCDTVAELAALPLYHSENDPTWAGGTEKQAKKWALEGKYDEVAESDSILRTIEGKLEGVATPRWRIVPDVVGTIPCVADYISGAPTAMRRRIKTRVETAPLTIVVSISASANVPPEAMRTRGIALLALTRLLCMQRPVSLWVGGVNSPSNRHSGQVHLYTRVDTSPLDLAHAAFVLASPAYNRQIRLRTESHNTLSVPPPYVDDPIAYRAALEGVFPNSGDMIVFPRMSLQGKKRKGINSSNALMLKNPTAWVLEQYHRMVTAHADNIAD